MSSASSVSSDPQTISTQDPLVQKLFSFMGVKARIMVTDGRVFVGMLQCIDNSKNLILAGTDEYKDQGTNDIGSL
jgi:small nuclear ribonucleoprotein (snRNP)-like protein